MKVKELKQFLSEADDDKMVIFHEVVNGTKLNISYSVDEVEDSESFFVLKSID